MTTTNHRANNEDAQARQRAEIRRQMYERIARGHALAEAEDQARHTRQPSARRRLLRLWF